MSFYKTGTTSLTNASAAVTGAGTAWVDAGTLNAGDIFYAPGGVVYEILSIQSNTGLTLATPYLGTTASGQAYSIIPIGLLPSSLALQVKTTLNTASTALAAAPTRDGAGGVAGLTGFALNVWNAAKTFKSLLSFAGTANRSHVLPDKDGTVAMTSDITGGTAAGSFTTLSATGALTTAGMKEDAAGNLGIGGSTHPWLSDYKALDITSHGSVYSRVSSNEVGISSNNYRDSGATYRYSTTAPAAQFSVGDGVFIWSNAVSGSAGGPINGNNVWTPLMTLDASGNVTPGANGTQSFGSTSLRWSQVWCTAGAFNTSDARLKTPVTLLSVVEKQAAAQFSREIGTFQWLDSVKTKGADNARHHVGITVQRAQEILASFGLNPWRYGFMGYDQWCDEFVENPEIEAVAAVPAVLDENGQVVTPAVEAVAAKAAWTEQTKTAGNAYAFRYDQLNMFIAAGIEYRLSALEAK